MKGKINIIGPLGPRYDISECGVNFRRLRDV